jgi:spore coat protein U-like protein
MSVRLRVSQIISSFFFFLAIASLCYGANTGTVSVSGVVLSKGHCTFNSTTVTLSFGNLDPGNSVDKNANTTLIFTCNGNGNNLITFSITYDSGLYESGPNAPRMRNTTQTTEYLPYSLTLNPTSGSVPKKTNTSLAISGTVRGVDYQDAYPGNYSDSVIISTVP